MAGKPKHSYVLRQKPSTSWEILALNADGEEFYYGDFSLKQNAVRWGDSHKNPNKFPRVIERDSIDELLNDSTPYKPAGIDSNFQSLCSMAGINQSDQHEVSDFTSIPPELLQSFPDPATGNLIWQPNGSV